MEPADVQVDAYAGYKGEETPRAFTIDGLKLGVQTVIERWYTETHSYFRVLASNGQRNVLRYEWETMQWELVMQER